MFNSITWGQYFIAVTLLLVCYYVFIGLRFYRWEIMSVIGIKKVEDNAIAISTVANFKKSFENERDEDYLPKPSLEVDISPVVQSFTDEIKAYLQESDDDALKDELLHSIQTIITKYPVLKNVDYKHELIQFLFNESNAKYPNLLQLNEIKELLS
jgi:hypothetical protein